MKNKTYKIILIISIFTLLFSLMVIPSLAYDFNGVITEGDNFTFKENLDFSFTFSEYTLYFNIADDSSNRRFSGIQFSYPGRPVLTYIDDNDVSVTVYDDGWLDDSYRHIVMGNNTILTGSILGFFTLNIEEPPPESMYDVLYDLISSTIYGDRPLTSFETNITTILSTIACVCVFGLPLIAVFWLVKFFFSLGRNW